NLRERTDPRMRILPIFLSTDTPPTLFSTLSLHDALPISLAVPASALRGPEGRGSARPRRHEPAAHGPLRRPLAGRRPVPHRDSADRKSTRLNSSHDQISYAVFCLKKKNILHLGVCTHPTV